MLEDAREFASLDRPTLLLGAWEASSREEAAECFVLAEFGKSTSSQPKVLTLKPAESVQMSYKLTSFYYIGHAGPRKSSGFLNVLQPGEHEVNVRGIITYSNMEPHKGDYLESPPVMLKCNFPLGRLNKNVEQAEGSSGTGNDSRK